MNFDRWEPVYEAIRADFGYDRDGDRLARDTLAELVEPFDLDRVPGANRRVAIVGGAGLRPEDDDRIDDAETVVAASNAAATLRDRGCRVDCMVTDLDKVPETAVRLTHEGTPVVVHAHGDNVDAIERWVPEMDGEQVLATTQVRPTERVYNFGGFTDGDRAAFLADHLGAETLSFAGWDFDDPDVSDPKRRKLEWAARLLGWLELERSTQFDILEGRRESLDLSALPV